MNLLRILTGLYGKLHNYPLVPFWVLTPLRKMTRGVANIILPNYMLYIHKKRQLRGDGIIISLTSFPDRISNVWMVVESLKSQSIKPEKIILWLSKIQFPLESDIPQNLRECEDSLFEIRVVDDDIRSHKKYLYMLKEFSHKTFVTCDDDVYYHSDMLLNLVRTSKRFSGCICANTTTQLSYDENGKLLPYLQWNRIYKPFSSHNNVQIGVGGVLYPPHCLHHFAQDVDSFMKVAPIADDLWLNMMARLNNTPVVQTDKNVLPLPIMDNSPSLSSLNNGSYNMNDRQIRQMREWLRKEQLEDVYDLNYIVEFK